DVGDDPLAGAVVDEVHDVAEDQAGPAGRRRTGERRAFAVHVGDDEHAQPVPVAGDHGPPRARHPPRQTPAGPPRRASGRASGERMPRGENSADIPAIPQPTMAATTRRPRTPNLSSGSIEGRSMLTANARAITQANRATTPTTSTTA